MSRRLGPRSTLQDRLNRYMRVDANGCWIWTGFVNPGGYGKTKMGGRMHIVHRLTYEAAVGPIPDGYHIDHLCKVRACCNPAHLEAVTPTVNTLRSDAPAAVNARKTHCNRDHELAGANLLVESNGHRRCRECRRISERERWPRRKEQRRARRQAEAA